jgi:hypothetical protein
MVSFIKITNIILNTNTITKIIIHQTKYTIHHAYDKTLYGNFWGMWGFGVGGISSYNDTIEICENKNPTDYKIISEWINNI